MILDNNIQVFFGLVRAGLWADANDNLNDNHNFFEGVDWEEVYRLAEEQSVVGLVSAGLDWFKVHDSRFTVPQTVVLQFVGQTLQIEQQNKAMNEFVAKLIDKLRKHDIYALLVKGQGVAQCYDRPLWRMCGDVDLLLSEDNYEKAKKVLLPLASDVESEYTHFKHLGMTINGWVVELHGRLHCGLSSKIERELYAVQDETFNGGQIRYWMNVRTQIFLLSAENEVFYLITHILQHFYKGGIGIRQICDWCRLLYTYRDTLNVPLLESRLRKAGLMSEWKAFAAFAVEYLGMPVEAMPLYNEDDNQNKRLHRQAKMICDFVMEVGNFGHNREVRTMNSRTKGRVGYLRRKLKSLCGRLSDMLRHFSLFPLDSIRFFGGVIRSGLHAAVRGE